MTTSIRSSAGFRSLFASSGPKGLNPISQGLSPTTRGDLTYRAGYELGYANVLNPSSTDLGPNV
eukprot:1385716-Amorphochlora_amoeboformis.AAC.2